MIRRPPRSTRTDTLFPYTTLFRSGVEVDGIVSPTSALRFAFGLSYLEQKYIKLEAPAILAPFFQGAEGFTGSPNWSYQAAIEYDLPIGTSLGKVTLHADHYYIGKYFQCTVLLTSYQLGRQSCRARV